MKLWEKWQYLMVWRGRGSIQGASNKRICRKSFYRALPPIYAPEEVVEKLAVYPPYSEEERNLDAHYRIHLTQKLFIASSLYPAFGFGKQDSRVIRQGTCRGIQ